MQRTEPGPILDVTPVDGEAFDRKLLEGMGHSVMVCHGPGDEDYCPIVEGERCELVDSAHGVVFKLDLDRPYHREILARYKEAIPADMPKAVSVGPGQAERYADLLDGLYVWSHEPTSADLDGFAALVEAADDTRI